MISHLLTRFSKHFRVNVRDGSRDMRHRALAAFLSVALFAIPSLGVTQNSAQPSPSAMELAKKLVNIRTGAMFATILPGVITSVQDQIRPLHPEWATDLTESTAIMRRQYESRAAELSDRTARIYAKHFTEQELRDLLAFYQSPVGQKSLAEEPRAMDESMADAQAWANQLEEDVMASMKAELKRRGHNMQ